MCLFPGMMGGGQDANANAPPEAKKQQCNLYILAVTHFALAITLCIAVPPLGLSEIFTAMILMCTAYAMNFCMVILYIIFMLQDVVQYFSAIGLLIQTDRFTKCYHNDIPKDCDPFNTTVIIIFFVFSVVSIAVAFQAYRIFKAMAMGQMGGNGGMFLQGMNMPVGRGGRDNDTEDGDDERGRYQAPTGPTSASN